MKLTESTSYHLSEALRIFGDKTVFRPEKARALYKESLRLRAMQEEEQAAQVIAHCASLYNEINPGAMKDASDLTSDDLDEAVAFWSR